MKHPIPTMPKKEKRPAETSVTASYAYGEDSKSNAPEPMSIHNDSLSLLAIGGHVMTRGGET